MIGSIGASHQKFSHSALGKMASASKLPSVQLSGSTTGKLMMPLAD